MYIPSVFKENDNLLIQQLIKANPLATLIQHTNEGLTANHIPLLWVAGGEQGQLIGHVSKANPLWQELTNNSQVLAVFQGADTYITPSWYATKEQDHKAVPTWNYMAVHVYGKLSIIDNPIEVRKHLTEMVTEQEATFVNPWQLTDAPEDYLAGQIKGIVVVKLTIDKLLAKWKVSQNQPVENQQTVIEGLTALATDNGKLMAEQVARKLKSQAE